MPTGKDMNPRASAASTRTRLRETKEFITLSWRGDERIEVALNKQAGVMDAPVTVRVGRRALTFGGFYVVMNEVRATRRPRDPLGSGSGKGQRPRLCEPPRWQVQGGRVVFDHVLSHPKLKSPTRVRVEVWMAAGDKAIRFRISARARASTWTDWAGAISVPRASGRGDSSSPRTWS